MNFSAQKQLLYFVKFFEDMHVIMIVYIQWTVMKLNALSMGTLLL